MLANNIKVGHKYRIKSNGKGETLVKVVEIQERASVSGRSLGIVYICRTLHRNSLMVINSANKFKEELNESN